MIRPKPPENYQDTLHGQLTRIHEGQNRQLLLRSFLVFFVGIALAALLFFAFGALIYLVTRSGYLATMSGITLGGVLGPTCAVYLFATRFQLLPDDSLICPHCESEIEYNQPHNCGFCGQKYHPVAHAIADPCRVYSCKKQPLAILCPSCNNDIVLRPDEYNAADSTGFGKNKNTNKFLKTTPARLFGLFR